MDSSMENMISRSRCVRATVYTIVSYYCLWKTNVEWMKTTISSYQFFNCLLRDRYNIFFDILAMGSVPSKILAFNSTEKKTDCRRWTAINDWFDGEIQEPNKFPTRIDQTHRNYCVLYHLNMALACGVNQHGLPARTKIQYKTKSLIVQYRIIFFFLSRIEPTDRDHEQR